jgi:hypothetical protein
VKYSRANIKGMIVKKISSELIIKETKTNKMALINFNKKTGLYTLYGGNVPLDVLRPDIKAWVWFENCETPTKKTPLAIMILISSTDPNDQVSEWKTMPDYLK